MHINDVGMTRNHFQIGDIARVRMVVLHATAGRYPGDYNWLRQGGSTYAPVSIHYYIDKAGAISRMVEDKNIAWHAGLSTWEVDGQTIPYNEGCNPVSIGIELENLNNGQDPYPQEQYDAALRLTRQLVATYDIPRAQLVRHLDIAPGRKTDPRAFPWERFVAEVYQPQQANRSPVAAPAEPAASASEPAPTPEPLPPAQQLRRFLVDLAYRAVGTSCPEGWPLLRETISRQTGMPVVAITPDGMGENDPEAQARAVRLAGQEPLLLEAYGRDLFYAPPDRPEQPERLSGTAPGLLRDVLLHALFRAADPAQGFQPDWAFHRLYVENMAGIGVPISPNYRLSGTTSDGRSYACQHFALDTLCSPVDDWGTIIRLSDLLRGMYADDPHQPWERELRALLLNDLYRRRTGRTFDQKALFCQYAISEHLGAPLGKAEYIDLEGQKLVAMPFALDVIYCRVPADGAWGGVVVNDMPETLSSGAPRVARLSTLLRQGNSAAALPAVLGGSNGSGAAQESLTDLATYTGPLLGDEVTEPVRMDLTMHIDTGTVREVARPDLLVIYPTAGPASADLTAITRPERPTWHYYVDRQGVLTCLVDERHVARPAAPLNGFEQSALDHRSLAVAVEGGTDNMPAVQHGALVWLLRNVMQRFQLKRDQIMTSGGGRPGTLGSGAAGRTQQMMATSESTT